MSNTLKSTEYHFGEPRVRLGEFNAQIKCRTPQSES